MYNYLSLILQSMSGVYFWALNPKRRMKANKYAELERHCTAEVLIQSIVLNTFSVQSLSVNRVKHRAN